MDIQFFLDRTKQTTISQGPLPLCRETRSKSFFLVSFVFFDIFPVQCAPFRSAVIAGEEEAVNFFNSWQQLVISSVPREKLTIYNVKQGWAPLASLLGMEAPDEPFPDINDGLTVTLIVLGGYYILVLVIPCLLASCLWKKSAKFRSILQRIFGLCFRTPLEKLRSCRKSKVMNNNSSVKNNNIQSGDNKFSYVKYSNLEVWFDFKHQNYNY